MDTKKIKSIILLVVGLIPVVIWAILPLNDPIVQAGGFINYITLIAIYAMYGSPILVGSVVLIILGINGLQGNKNTSPEPQTEEQKQETLHKILLKRIKWRTIFVLSIVPYIVAIGWAIIETTSKETHFFLGQRISQFESFLFDMMFVISVGSVVLVPALILLIISIIKLRNISTDIKYFYSQDNIVLGKAESEIIELENQPTSADYKPEEVHYNGIKQTTSSTLINAFIENETVEDMENHKEDNN